MLLINDDDDDELFADKTEQSIAVYMALQYTNDDLLYRRTRSIAI